MTKRIRMPQVKLPREKPPREKPGAEILNHILRAGIELMEDQARSWRRSAERARRNDWGPKIAAALVSTGEQPSSAAVNAYTAMCERCANNLSEAAIQLEALHAMLRKQGLCVEA